MRLFIAASAIAAASATWTELCSSSTNCPTIMMGVSCASKDMCAIVGGYSNTPEGVYYSKDQFTTYTAATMKKDSLMLLDIALDKSGNGATAGIGILGTGALWTSDVTDWDAGTDIDFLTMQDMNEFGNGEFGGVGNIGNDNGVIMSTDHGKDWTTKKWPASLSNITMARYGSFPSPQVLYVSGGQWPSSKSNATQVDTDCIRISKKLCIPSKDKNAIAATNKRLSDTDGYYAMMTKSTDGGNTWVSQFEKADAFYFNDVHCFDVNNCIAVGEGFTDGPAPGGYIYGTTDGKTWNLLKKITNSGQSLMRVHMVSKTEAWAAGGDSSGGTFYHTTDGGKTWNLDGKLAPFVGTVAGMHFVDETLGFAVGITSLQIATMLKYTPSN